MNIHQLSILCQAQRGSVCVIASVLPGTWEAGLIIDLPNVTQPGSRRAVGVGGRA